MAGKHSRNKGANFEREVANALREAGLPCRRVGEAQRTTGEKECDLVAGRYVVECKHHSKYPNPIKELEIADSRAGRCLGMGGTVPLAVVKGDRKQAVVALYLIDFLHLIRQLESREKM